MDNMVGEEMKKAIFILMLICSLILSSCRNDDSSEELDPHDIFDSIEYDRMIMDEVMPKVEKALEENDVELLKSLFSPYVIETQSDLEKDIFGLFLAFEGEVVSYEEDWPDDASSSKRNGIYVYRKICFGYRTVETSTGKSYCVEIYYTVVNDENPDEVGLSRIYLIDPYGEEYFLAKAGDIEKRNT